MDEVPKGARPVARILVLSEDSRLLLLEGARLRPNRWWVSPGGGLQTGETFAEAAVRELLEETGFAAPLGPCVWYRRHRFEWFGKQHDQFEKFFVVRDVPRRPPSAPQADGYVIGHRWWTIREIQESADDFSPSRLAAFLEPIVAGEYPSRPIDVGA